MSCDYCGTGLLEIKCPFTYKHSVLSDIDDEKFYLQITGNGEFMLSKTHQYYSGTGTAFHLQQTVL